MGWRLINIVVVTLMLAGCATTEVSQEEPVPIPATPPPLPEKEVSNEKPVVPFDGWVFERRAIKVRVEGSENLNSFRERKHTLVLGIFQLADPNMFNTLRGDTQGLQKLLTQGAEADPSIVAFNKTVVSPGEVEYLSLDRAEGARQIGFVAGYYELEPTRVSKLVPITAVQDGKVGFWARINPLEDPPPARPARLTMWLNLGSKGVTELITREE